MSQALQTPDLISLAAGFTDNTTLPVDLTRELVDQLLSQPKKARASLQYGTGAGDPTLRALTANRLAQLDQTPASADPLSIDNLMITNGSQQFLYLVTEVLCDPGDIILVEDPTYFVYLSIMQSHGIEARGVKMTPTGVCPEDLERVLAELHASGDLHRLKFFYSVTYFQNPTGITTEQSTKQAALECLRRYEQILKRPIYYLEDAAYRELAFPGYTAPPSALSLPEYRDRIIYTSTFSKPFATGLRIGFGILPTELGAPVLSVKGNHDFGSANFLQQILAGALGSDHYTQHLEKVNRGYARKARTMVKAINAYFPDRVQITEPHGGLCLWAHLPGTATTGPKSALFREALEKKVLYVPGEFAFADDPTRRKPRSTMRLSFGSAAPKAITTGIERLGKVITQRLSRRR